MSFWIVRRLPLALLVAGLCGCLPSSSNLLEEQKEPHYLAGKARVNSLDFQGAAESFEKALEVNPQSSSAHFELGWLFEQKLPDPAAAIYHYEKYLKLRPNADNAELIRQRINTCKQELAKAALPLPVTPGLQREFEQLAQENKRLKEELARWQAYVASLPRVPTNTTPILVMRRSDAGDTTTAPSATGRGVAPSAVANPASGRSPVVSPLRSHTIKSGETPSAIARRYGVKLDALLAANPGVNAKRLQVGQKLNIPAS